MNAGSLAAASVLDSLCDAARVEPMLREALADARHGSRYSVIAVRRIVWKPDRRALLAYELRDARSGRRWSVFGKHYARAGRAERVNATWTALERVSFQPGAGVPALLGWCPDVSMVFYRPAPGWPLDRLPVRALEGSLRRTGAMLGALHRSRLPLGRRLEIAAEVQNAGDWAERVAYASPRHAATVRRLWESLATVAPAVAVTGDAPIHKDFHYRHVIVGSGLTMLDFDEMRLGDPRLDLAHFCVYLRLLSVRRPPRLPIANLEGAFLQGYGSPEQSARSEAFSFFAAYTCLKIAKQLCVGSGVAPHPDGLDRDRELSMVLSLGNSLVGEQVDGDGHGA